MSSFPNNHFSDYTFLNPYGPFVYFHIIMEYLFCMLSVFMLNFLLLLRMFCVYTPCTCFIVYVFILPYINLKTSVNNKGNDYYVNLEYMDTNYKEYLGPE